MRASAHVLLAVVVLLLAATTSTTRALELRHVATITLQTSATHVHTIHLGNSTVCVLASTQSNSNESDGSMAQVWCSRDGGSTFVQQRDVTHACGAAGSSGGVVRGGVLYCPDTTATPTWQSNSTLCYRSTAHTLLDDDDVVNNNNTTTLRNFTFALGANASATVRALHFGGNVLTPAQRGDAGGSSSMTTRYYYMAATMLMQNDTRAAWLLRSRDGFAWTAHARLPLADTHTHMRLYARGGSTLALVATAPYNDSNEDAVVLPALLTSSYDLGKHWSDAQAMHGNSGSDKTKAAHMASAVHASGIVAELGFASEGNNSSSSDNDDVQLRNVVLDASDKAMAATGTRALAQLVTRNTSHTHPVTVAMLPHSKTTKSSAGDGDDDDKLLVAYRNDEDTSLQVAVYAMNTSAEWHARAVAAQRKRAEHEAAVRELRRRTQLRERREQQRRARELRAAFARDDAAAIARARADAEATGDGELVLVRRVQAATAHLEKDTFFDELDNTTAT